MKCGKHFSIRIERNFVQTRIVLKNRDRLFGHLDQSDLHGIPQQLLPSIFFDLFEVLANERGFKKWPVAVS